MGVGEHISTVNTFLQVAVENTVENEVVLRENWQVLASLINASCGKPAQNCGGKRKISRLRIW